MAIGRPVAAFLRAREHWVAGCRRCATGVSVRWPQVKSYLAQQVPPLSPAHLDAALAKHAPLGEVDPTELRNALLFLRGEVGLRPDSLARAVRRTPALLTQPVGSLEASLACVTSLVTPPIDEVAVLVRGCPHVLLVPPENMLRTRKALLLRSTDLRSVLQRNFPLLTLDPERVCALLHFLEAEAGFAPRDCGKLVGSYPAMLAYSPKRDLRPLVAFLREHRLDPSARVYMPLYAWPNTERTLRPALELLLDAGYERQTLLEEPALLCFSLDLRLRPRMRIVRERRARGFLGRAYLPPLRLVTAESDATFCTALGVSRAEYAKAVADGGRDT